MTKKTFTKVDQTRDKRRNQDGIKRLTRQDIIYKE